MKFTAGLAIGQLSGSLAGVVASRNRFGPYFRNRAIPVNPNTGRQMAARNAFSSLATAWSNDLSQLERDAWNLYASQVTVKDALGNDIFLSGFNMFIRTNTITIPALLPQVDTGPTVFTLAETDPTFAATISQATQLITVAFDINLAWDNEDDAAMQISMSRPVTVGRAFIPPTLRRAGFILGDATTPPTSPQTIATPFVITETQNVIVAARILRADGRLSDFFRVTVSIDA